MATPTYEQVLAQASQLEQTDQLRLLENLAAHLRLQISGKPQHGITALRGLGKEIWRGIDVQEYVYQERAAWDGWRRGMEQ